jgi:integrase
LGHGGWRYHRTVTTIIGRRKAPATAAIPSLPRVTVEETSDVLDRRRAMRYQHEIVFKRCGCTDAISGRQLGTRCPQLAQSDHGSWYYAVQVTTVGGRWARQRHGGYRTREAALAARQAILDAPAQQSTAAAWTVARWLRFWLRLVEPHLRPSTLHSYRGHIDRYLIPNLGRLSLADLTGRRLQACFDQLTRRRTGNGAPLAPATVDRVRATLRSALNTAVREGLITTNSVRMVRVAHPVRPHPVVWTDERVAAWRRTGARPPVAVWTLPQLITFLIGVQDDRLAALWWLVALRGLRRGEITGLHADDLDTRAQELTIHSQHVALPRQLYCGPPKSRASNRTIALDATCLQRLAHQATQQHAELLEHRFTYQRRGDARIHTGPGWQRTGRALFTYADGRPIKPEYLTHRFQQIVRQLDLPPIRLHDLRHGAATLALAAHIDLKVIQQMLGHTSIVTTADTYTSVLPEIAHHAAQTTADMILNAARTLPGANLDDPAVTHTSTTGTAKTYCQT